MIVVRLKGGLGNQMFQYATGKAMAKRTSAELFFDDSYYNEYGKRSYKLDCYRLDIDMISKDKVGKLPLQVIHQDMIDFRPELTWGIDDVCLDGYWQSEEYFMDIKKHLQADFSISGVLNQRERGLLHKVLDSESVGVHVRLGDYLTEESGDRLEFIGMEYYEMAFKWLSNKLHHPTFYIFSDDIAYLKEHLNFQQGIYCDQTDRDFMDMFIMRKCQHNIIANSSFSWWSAWLSEKDGYTIAPRYWFATEEARNKDVRIVPDRWKRI